MDAKCTRAARDCSLSLSPRASNMITVVGSANVDLVSAVPRLPAPGETVLATGYAQIAGGKGANQAVAAARAGSSVNLVARLGADLYGDALLTSLREAGVLTEHVVRDEGASTGTAHITVDPSGENMIVVVPGANARLAPSDVDLALPAIQSSTLVVVQLEIPLETVQHAIAVARSAGVPVILNPAPAQPLSPELLHAVTVLVPNGGELALLSGMGSPVDPATAARLLVSTGVPTVIATLGPEGALVVTNDAAIEIDAPPVDAVDTTGAGDAFIGNLAYALDRGEEVEAAARFACYAATLSVTRRGAQPGMPTSEETGRFMNETAP